LNRIGGFLAVAIFLGVTVVAKAPAKSEWVSLFIGKDLSGWKNNGEEKWAVEQGTILCESAAKVSESAITANNSLRTGLHTADFGDSVYAYCDSCGKTAILSMWDKRIPKQPDCPGQQELCSAMEPYVQPLRVRWQFQERFSTTVPQL